MSRRSFFALLSAALAGAGAAGWLLWRAGRPVRLLVARLDGRDVRPLSDPDFVLVDGWILRRGEWRGR